MRLEKSTFLKLSADILERGNILRFQARGNSMQPAIRDGDILNIEPIAEKGIRWLDVIFYRSAQGDLSCHRVIKKVFSPQSSILITKGDANIGAGEAIIFADVLGRVKSIERSAKEIHISHNLHKLAYIFYRIFFPYLRWLKARGAGLISCLQGFRIYRSLAKRLCQGVIIYQQEYFGNSGNSIFARREGRIIGKVTIDNFLEENPPYYGWWIFDMWVNWRYRGLGIGRRLTEMACDFIKQQKVQQVKLLVFDDNAAALNLYQKLRFYQISIPQLDEELREEAQKFKRQRIILQKDIS